MSPHLQCARWSCQLPANRINRRLRSAFWELPAGHVFSTLLERFAAANRATHHTIFEWLGRYTNIADSANADGLNWQAFDAIAAHTCALDIPAEVSQIKFRDVYSMGLPIMVPVKQWMLRLLKKMYRSWGQLNSEWSDRLPEQPPAGQKSSGDKQAYIWEDTRHWPHEPFYNGAQDSLARLEYWLPLADHVRYPHTATFASLPDLLDVVARTDWAEKSVRMRAHFRRVVRNVERFYYVSLVKLLTRTAAN